MKKFTLIAASCLLLVTMLSGCATTPTSISGLPAYSIAGIKYFPLISFCEKEGINWNYDIFTKTVNLEKDAQHIILLPGESIVLVNGAEKDLRYPVKISRGTMLLPASFKELVYDPLFKPYTPGAAISRPALCKLRKIVIDPGHGGKDPGAIGKSGLREKDVVLDISRRVVKYLEKSGKEVILTRSTDIFIPLARRAEIANRANADIFVSIHANANRSKFISGFEVYCLSDSVDDHSRALAFVENNENIKLENTDYDYAAGSDLQTTVWDMVNTSNRQESQALARILCKRVSSELGAKTNGAKGGPFYVLKWTQMPAVLVEVGYLSNPSEEQMLKSTLYRQQLAEHIAAGILNYCDEFSLVKGYDEE